MSRKAKKPFRYIQLVAEIEQKITNGTYQPGEKLPSIRKLHEQSNLSVSTVYHAYMELESLGLIESRYKSGYYVKPVVLRTMQAPASIRSVSPPREVRMSSMINSVVSAINDPRLVPLGMTVTDTALLPFKPFSRILKSLSQKDVRSMLTYSLSEGHPELRRQLAFRMLGVVRGISPEDIIITNGCMEAVALSLLALTHPGETVAIETPTNFSFLQLIKELGLMVAEVPTDPKTGVIIDKLEEMITRTKIAVCLFMTNFHNPLGALMPDAHKEQLVRLLEKHEIPVIEDDISAEIHFGEKRPVPLKALDRKGLITTCSSFSKTLAPGLRVGWVIPGKRCKKKVQNLKAGISVSTSTLDQYLIARFLDGGAYERHLRLLIKSIRRQMVQTALSIHRHFPRDIRLALPRGGSLLWVELPSHIDGLKVYQQALTQGISIIPGEVCSNSGYFKNFIQISCGIPFTSTVENAIETLGTLICKMT